MIRHLAGQGAGRWSTSGFSRTVSCLPDHWEPQLSTGDRRPNPKLSPSPCGVSMGRRWEKFCDGWGVLTIGKGSSILLSTFIGIDM